MLAQNSEKLICTRKEAKRNEKEGKRSEKEPKEAKKRGNKIFCKLC
jgi:hypothetical protein